MCTCLHCCIVDPKTIFPGEKSYWNDTRKFVVHWPRVLFHPHYSIGSLGRTQQSVGVSRLRPCACPLHDMQWELKDSNRCVILKIDSRNVNLNSVVIIYETHSPSGSSSSRRGCNINWNNLYLLSLCMCVENWSEGARGAREDQTKAALCGSVLIIRC